MTNAVETEQRAPEAIPEPSTGKSAAGPPSERAEIPVPAGSDNPESLDALKRLSELYPEEVEEILNSNDAGDCTSAMFGKMMTKIDRQGWACLADVAEFIEDWRPGNNGPVVAQIIAMLQKCSLEFLRGLADEIAYQLKQDEDAKEWRTTNCAVGQRMKAEHLFQGWATIIRNMIPMLEAITCFTDEDGRQTKFDDQDGMGIDQMVRFALKELEALAQDCDRAGDYSNPRFITPSGHVWRLNIEAVLIDKPDEPEGGAS